MDVIEAGAAEPPAGASAAGHRTLTLLFTDIEGSSRIEQAVGTPAYAELRRRHREILRAAFGAHGGVEHGTEGDSFFVAFESGAAAVAAAVEAQRGLAREAWPPEAAIRVRVGIHTGDVSFADGDPVGIAINRAARIAGAGHGGQIVVSEATRALTDAEGTGIGFRDLGLHRLKDFEPMRLFQVEADGLDSAFPPLRSAAPTFGGLPLQPTSFVGRSDAVEAVHRLVLEHRLVTLTGPGGTGKTRLALAAAGAASADFPDGTAWVGLSPIADPQLVPAAFAAVLGVVDEGTVDLVDASAGRIGEARLLLVVDNFEQVMPAAPIVGRLLAACPNACLLVTSRGPLHLAAEQEYAVQPLSLPAATGDGSLDLEALARNEAIALFVERGRAVRPDFALTAESVPAVLAICERLEGLPLAIELAAARLRLLTPAAIRDRLDHSLGLLTGGASDLPGRQRTLRAAVAWSHDLLDPPARELFARLSVFAGGWSLDAAEAICGDERELGLDLLDGLLALADQGLVRRDDAADGEPRFRMLHVIREFGLEQLAAAGETGTVRDRHLAFFADLAARAEREILGAETGRWLDRLELEHDNVRAALRWSLEAGQVRTGLAMAGELWRFWHQRGHLGEGLAMLRELLACPDAAEPTPERAKALNGAGGLAYWQNDFAAAAAYYEEHAALVRALGDRRGLAEALLNLAFMAAISHDFGTAERDYAESAAIAESLGDLGQQAAALVGLGMLRSLGEDLAGSREAASAGAEVARRNGDRYWLASAEGVLARTARKAGDLAEARRLALEALELFAAVHDQTGVAMEAWDFAELAHQRGAYERALVLAAASRRLTEQVAGGAPPSLSQSVDVLAAAAERLPPDVAEAARERGRALSMDELIALAGSDVD